MYQITRSNRIKEDLQFCHADGSEALTIHVDLNVDQIANRVYKARDEVRAAQLAVKKNPENAESMEAFGKAVISLFAVIFGEDDTARLVSFYENSMGEMLLDVFPFINSEILPKIALASENRKTQIMAAAQMVGNRAARRRK